MAEEYDDFIPEKDEATGNHNKTSRVVAPQVKTPKSLEKPAYTVDELLGQKGILDATSVALAKAQEQLHVNIRKLSPEDQAKYHRLSLAPKGSYIDAENNIALPAQVGR